MSFLPRFMGVAGGLVDGKPGALSNIGNVVGGPIDAMGLGKATQRMVDKTGVNGQASRDAARGDVGNNGGAGLTPLSGRPRLGRGSSSLSV